MKNKSLWLFFILTFLFSWIMWLPGVLITYGHINSNDFVVQFNAILKWVGGIGPSFVAIILIYKEQGKRGVKVLLTRAFKLKLGLWYTPIFLLIPFTVVFAHILNFLIGAPFPNSGILQEPWWIPVLFIMFLVMVAGEEFGWRGFALDRLQTKWSAITSSIILGGLWTIWHIPMFLSKGFGHYDLQLPFDQFFITLVLVSILITWLQNNTGSLAPAFIVHALINLSGEVLPLIGKNTETQGDYTQWIIANSIFAIVVIIVLVVWGSKTLTRRSKTFI
ncbi:MAG: CPBP family intramembrane metalloprotease [Ignavibacteria bacterium]|nr:CPBP family intramembrane metalloprotease [Ignavibacteria bacterium]